MTDQISVNSQFVFIEELASIDNKESNFLGSNIIQLALKDTERQKKTFTKLKSHSNVGTKSSQSANLKFFQNTCKDPKIFIQWSYYPFLGVR